MYLSVIYVEKIVEEVLPQAPLGPPKKPLPPVIGDRAQFKALANVPPPVCITLPVLAFGESRTAREATPIIAIKTVTIEVTNLSLMQALSEELKH